jgi:hypothetical protein
MVVVEILQNMNKHSHNSETGNKGIFILGKTGKHYIINAANIMENDKIGALKKQLDFISSSNKETLKEVYKQTLMEGKISEKGGAGLGLMDIAKESNGLEYEFILLDEKTSLFSLSVRI